MLGLNLSVVIASLGKSLDLFSLIPCICEMKRIRRYLTNILWGLNEILLMKCSAEYLEENVLVIIIIDIQTEEYIYLDVTLLLDIFKDILCRIYIFFQ